MYFNFLLHVTINHSLQDKSCSAPDFLNTILLEHDCSHLFIVYVCYNAIAAKLNGYEEEHFDEMFTEKIKIFTISSLTGILLLIIFKAVMLSCLSKDAFPFQKALITMRDRI